MNGINRLNLRGLECANEGLMAQVLSQEINIFSQYLVDLTWRELNKYDRDKKFWKTL